MQSSIYTRGQSQMRWVEVGCYEVQKAQAHDKGKTMDTAEMRSDRQNGKSNPKDQRKGLAPFTWL